MRTGMKRFLSLVLVLTLALGLVQPAWATSDGVAAIDEPSVDMDVVDSSILGGSAEDGSVLEMYYDDHLDMSGKTVEIVDPGAPTSYQVGYGIAENTLDTAVVTLEGDTLVATGAGTASVKIDGQLTEVTVTAAPISLLFLGGQSNMEGVAGSVNASIVCPDGQVYSTFGDINVLKADNAATFVPSALTGSGSTVNMNGTTENLYPIYQLTEAGEGKKGSDSGYAYEWNKLTGEKVWVVNAAHGGKSITTWQKGKDNYNEAVALFSSCQQILSKEIAAGHFTLSHMGFFWCQGCADEQQTAKWYADQYVAMHEAMQKDLTWDIDGDGNEDKLEFSNITAVMAGHDKKTGYRYEEGLYDSADGSFFTTYEELEMRGPRVAQYWLANNPEYPEINMVCNLAESWVTMPDGSDSVVEYFASHYENGRVDYPVQVAQKDSWYTPTTPKAVKDDIHYNQIGYNEVGREAARNTLILLGEIEDTNGKTTVSFVDWTGYREVDSVAALTDTGSATLVVPRVSPCYRAKEVSYQISEGLSYDYYDLVADSELAEGTLTAVSAAADAVTVNVAHQHAYTSKISTVPGDCQTEGYDVCQCACGETDNITTGLGDHTFGPWTMVDDERAHTCILCGLTESFAIGTHYDESVSGNYYSVVSQKNYILCDGATESEIVINNSDGSRRQVLHVVEVDTGNPNVEILPGYYGIDKDLTDSNNWSATVVEAQMDYYRDQLGYNIVAGMNSALSYASNAPCTFLVYNGKVLADTNKLYNNGCEAYLAVTKNADGTVSCELRSVSEALHGDEWQAVASNFGFYVNDGKLVLEDVDRTSDADRSMIGVKADGSLVIVQSEGRNAPYSIGLSHYEKGETMLALGCLWAVNCDGGGSSQILTKRAGEDDYILRNIPSDGTPRATIHSILIASKTAAEGTFDRISMEPECAYIAPGGSVNIEVKGLDSYGMPAPVPEGITYKATGGTFADGVFVSDGTQGQQTITAFYNDEEIGSVGVNVVIPDRIAFDNAALAVPYGQTVAVGITGYLGNTPVMLHGGGVKLELSENIGTVDGLRFTAVSEENAGNVSAAVMTATLLCNEELTATISVTVGKGSEVLYDFEDQDLHGWYRSMREGYNAVQAGGATYIVDASSGYVHSGNYAMAVEFDYSNTLESLDLRSTLVAGETVILKDAVRLGMWMYIPDEAVGLELMTKIATFEDAEGAVENEEGIYGTLNISGAGEADTTALGFNTVFDESGWHYVSVDLTGAEYAGLLAGSSEIGFFFSQRNGQNGYTYSEQKSVNGDFVFYIDDISVDYSDVADDRENPEFGELTYLSDGMGAAAALNGNTVTSNVVSFYTTVADNMDKNTYTGIDAGNVYAYIDGVDYTSRLSCSGQDELTLSLKDVPLSNGMHTVKFVAYDNIGNRSAIVRDIVVNSVDSAKVRVVPHAEAEYLLLGSVYYIDVVADNPETVSSVTVTMDLNNISVWQLDHMDVADGFQASYSLNGDENIAAVTVRSTGETDLSGEDQILVSIPIRTWELDPVAPKYERTEIWMYDDYKAAGEILPMDLSVEIDAGHVVYKDGSNASFTGPRIQVDTELRGTCTQSDSTAGNNISNEPWFADWNGGHDHRPETKQYYTAGSTNHVDAVALEDKAATCEESGYTGRTYCEVCQSVVDWGTTIPKSHNYTLIDGIMKCSECGELCNGIYEDAEYADGIKLAGWVDYSYYAEGVKLTGVQKVPSPEDETVQFYYNFGENGVCKNYLKYSGMFKDGDVYRYSYLGILSGGWYSIDSQWHYFRPDTQAAANGKVNVDGVDFEFEENGRLISGVWIKSSSGLRYYYGPGYYIDHWAEIDGEWYYFTNGYALTGISKIKKFGEGGLYVWADLGEDGKFTGYLEGFFVDQEGYLNYADEGVKRVGLYEIDGAYYFFAANGHAVTGEYYCWETHCDLPMGTYLFGDDYKAVNGILDKNGTLYYYENGKLGPAGLTKIGDDYYFVASNGKLAVDCEYYCWATNCDLPMGTYTFGPDGKMLNPPAVKFTVSGTVTSYNDEAAAVTVELIDSNGAVAYTTTVTGNSASYKISNVAKGTYTLKVSKANHVGQSYTVTVDGADVTQDAKLSPIGDVTGDGKVTATDYSRLLAHVKKTSTITDSYQLLCADVTGDGKITATDYSRLLAHVKKVSLLW